MEILHKRVEKVTYDYVPFTIDEVKEAFFKHRPNGLFINQYSSDRPYMYIEYFTDELVSYRYDINGSEGEYVKDSWELFYKRIRPYLVDIKFEGFKCYEIHRPNIPQYGCTTQCNECKNKQYGS